MPPRKPVKATPAELTALVAERMKAEWTLAESEKILSGLETQIRKEEAKIQSLHLFIEETDLKIAQIVTSWAA